jgi:hypothetical protein
MPGGPEQDQSWRLQAELSEGALDDIVAQVRRPDVDPADWPLPADVVVTHDGNTLFAYAASVTSIKAARKEVEALPHQATILISHWDEDAGDWAQVDPPLSGDAEPREQDREDRVGQIETRTMVATAGRQVRNEIEVVMHEAAANLNLELSVTEHRHLLTCQVLFEVTGPKAKIDQFAADLNAYELATMRTEREIMISPL